VDSPLAGKPNKLEIGVWCVRSAVEMPLSPLAGKPNKLEIPCTPALPSGGAGTPHSLGNPINWKRSYIYMCRRTTE